MIGPQHVLTAAHCTADQSTTSLKVVIGEHKTKYDELNRVDVSQIIDHPDYNSVTMNNDFSILKLAEPVKYSDKVQPACLPNNRREKYVGEKATVTGWGALSYYGSTPDELHAVDLTVTTNAMCRSSYGSYITDSMLCASDDGKDGEGKRDSCRGDTGGPLVTVENGRFALVS